MISPIPSRCFMFNLLIVNFFLYKVNGNRIFVRINMSVPLKPCALHVFVTRSSKFEGSERCKPNSSSRYEL